MPAISSLSVYPLSFFFYLLASEVPLIIDGSLHDLKAVSSSPLLGALVDYVQSA